MSYFKILTKTEYAVTSVFRLNYTTDDTKAKRIFCSLGYVYLLKSKQSKTRPSPSAVEIKEKALMICSRNLVFSRAFSCCQGQPNPE